MLLKTRESNAYFPLRQTSRDETSHYTNEASFTDDGYLLPIKAEQQTNKGLALTPFADVPGANTTEKQSHLLAHSDAQPQDDYLEPISQKLDEGSNDKTSHCINESADEEEGSNTSLLSQEPKDEETENGYLKPLANVTDMLPPADIVVADCPNPISYDCKPEADGVYRPPPATYTNSPMVSKDDIGHYVNDDSAKEDECLASVQRKPVLPNEEQTQHPTEFKAEDEYLLPIASESHPYLTLEDFGYDEI